MGLPLLLPDACWGVRRTCCCVISAGLVTLGRKKGLRVFFWLVASVVLPLGGHDWLDLDTTGLPCSLLHGGSRIAFASINTAATMRATTLVLLVAGAAALQPTLRMHAAARSRTSGCPVQKTTKGIDDLRAKRF